MELVCQPLLLVPSSPKLVVTDRFDEPAAKPDALLDLPPVPDIPAPPKPRIPRQMPPIPTVTKVVLLPRTPEEELVPATPIPDPQDSESESDSDPQSPPSLQAAAPLPSQPTVLIPPNEPPWDVLEIPTPLRVLPNLHSQPEYVPTPDLLGRAIYWKPVRWLEEGKRLLGRDENDLEICVEIVTGSGVYLKTISERVERMA